MKGKNTENNFVGQPIFIQIIDFTPKNKFDLLVRKHNSDYYYKAFDSWIHLITMLFCVFSRCDSMGEICDGMQALDGKLNHLGMDKSPAKSTAGDELHNRDEAFFMDVYFMLIEHFYHCEYLFQNIFLSIQFLTFNLHILHFLKNKNSSISTIKNTKSTMNL